MWFELDGRALTLAAADPALYPLLDAVPLHLQTGTAPTDPFARLALRSCRPEELAGLAAAALSGGGKRLDVPTALESQPRLTVLEGDQGLTLILPEHGLAHLSPTMASAEAFVVDPDSLVTAAFVAALVLSMAAERGYNPIHASLVERDGDGVMFCGERARGKTSSCLALARAGWTIRADDRCYVHFFADVPVVWGPGGTLRLRTDAAELWDDLAAPLAAGRVWAGKRVLTAAACGGESAAGSCEVRALAFPEVAGTACHRLTPLSKAVALQEMLVSTGLAALPAHAARHFKSLSALVERTPCYRLELGQDMTSLPQAIAEVLP